MNAVEMKVQLRCRRPIWMMIAKVLCWMLPQYPGYIVALYCIERATWEIRMSDTQPWQPMDTRSKEQRECQAPSK